MGFLQTCKKTFFRVSKNVKPQLFFLFFPIWWFFKKTEEKKTQISLPNCKNSHLFASKKNVFCKFTLVHRHLLNSRETVRSFTAVSLKLTWNSKNGQSFTETGCQKYVVFGMKSAKSTVSRDIIVSRARGFQRAAINAFLTTAFRLIYKNFKGSHYFKGFEHFKGLEAFRGYGYIFSIL